MSGTLVGSLARPVLVDRAVYGTITIMCVLIIYDGWTNLKVIDVIAIVVGPILAMFISHVFAASVAEHLALGRNRTRQEWLRTVRFESRFLLLAVPPVALLIALDAVGVSISHSIRVIIWIEGLSIGFWAGVSARRAGFGGRGVTLAVVAGFVVGAIVLLLQVVLQPGKAVQGGVADGAGHMAPAATAPPSPGARAVEAPIRG